MKLQFFSIFTLILLQFFTYGFARAMMWQFRISQASKRKTLYTLCFIFSNSLIILTLLRIWSPLFRLSAHWLVLLLFTTFTTIIIALASLIVKCLFPTQKTGRLFRIAAPLVLLSIYAQALYNAYTPVIRHVSININKPLTQPLRIGLASDLHLGVLFGGKQLDDLSTIMNREKVDIIFLPGDIMDDNTIAYEAEHMQAQLQKLRAPLGVYATLGNHDLFGHQREIQQALKQAGIQVLNDQAIFVDNRFWVVGRPDNLDTHRQSTPQLLKQTNTTQPIFLLDHRPTDVLAHAELPIDLQVSGHVHNGQVFPANLIVRAINRISYGYEQIKNSHFVVTSGYGFWGVPFRLGSQSEVWIIDVHGNTQKPSASK